MAVSPVVSHSRGAPRPDAGAWWRADVECAARARTLSVRRPLRDGLAERCDAFGEARGGCGLRRDRAVERAPVNEEASISKARVHRGAITCVRDSAGGLREKTARQAL